MEFLQSLFHCINITTLNILNISYIVKLQKKIVYKNKQSEIKMAKIRINSESIAMNFKDN